jgi:pyridinium-3,5-biscarboxylic acid mononucleotide sulfurtransferase
MNGKNKKFEHLNSILISLERVVLAFSGGADSAFLLKTSLDSLGAENVAAVTAASPLFPEEETKNAQSLAENLGADITIVTNCGFNLAGFRLNPPDRCYLCKLELFKKLEEIRKKRGFKQVIDGSNADDRNDYRPGARAAQEIGVRSPLMEAGFSKSDIRRLSKREGLPSWDKPAFSCLASRIPYQEEITKEKLSKIDKAESFLRKCGIRNPRVRSHGGIARIETDEKEIALFLDAGFRQKAVLRLKKLGFNYISLDLEGYRQGSLNEEIQ